MKNLKDLFKKKDKEDIESISKELDDITKNLYKRNNELIEEWRKLK